MSTTGKYSRPKKSHRTIRILAPLGAAVILAAASLAILIHTPQPAAQPVDIPPAAPTETEPTAAAAVTAADGQPGSLTCLASYTCAADQAQPDAVVAVWGDAQLTNRVLQIYYLNAIRTYRSGDAEPQPDISQPLENQRCPLAEGNISWQHYFLNQAIRSWQTQQALLEAAKEPRPVTEEAYKPNEREDLHGEYVSPDLPVNQFLYQDQPCYKPNTMHQSYLDNLADQMDALAAGLGYADLADCAQRVFGGTVDAEDLIAAARDYNFAYMYFTEWSYDAADGALSEDPQKDSLSEGDAYTVDMRHVLLIPEDAEIAPDGTVTADEAQWEACMQQAKTLLRTWEGEYLTTRSRDANFSRLANRNSADVGSAVNGGLYQSIRQGQLIAELDDWCFSPEREAGDCAIVRSPVGVHIVFFRGRSSCAEAEAQDAMLRRLAEEELEARRDASALKVDYSVAALWAEPAAEAVLPVDTLYADVAHERFPEVMVYFQQDYVSTPYGASYVGVSGCGVSVLAMLATYMNDTIITPAMMAKQYSAFYREGLGTGGEVFIYAPEELGFFLDRPAYQIDEFAEALTNGQLVVDLQYPGYFTTTGHYILLSGYNPEDDTFQVRDSNIKNYKKLEGNKTDRFTRDQVKNASNCGYIMQKKITRIPACARCGGDFEETAPQRLLTEDYFCRKCTAAMLRRSIFLSLMRT